MARVVITIKGVEKLQKRFDKIANSAGVKQAVVQGTSIVLSAAKHYAPVGRENGGALRASIHMDVKQTETEIAGKVFAGSGHAMYVEFGTGIVGEESLYPRAAELGLKYAQYDWVYTPDGGEHFYHTKGYRARPFMYPALKQNKKKIIQLIASAMKEDMRR